MPPALRPLAEVVGDNCKRLRARIGITQDELAKYARYVGLRWRASSVGDFEAGRAAPTFATVLAVAAALQWALEESAEHGSEKPLAAVSLADLVDGFAVSVTEAMMLPCETLAQWLSGAPVSLPPGALTSKAAVQVEARLSGMDGVLARSGLAEARVAKGLGVSAEVLALVSFELWGGTFTEERDRRAGADANKQKRGQVTRAMRAEVAAAVEKWSATEEGSRQWQR